MTRLILTAALIFNSLLTAQLTSLKDTSNQFDYVIITIPEYKEYCNDFKLHKEIYRGFNTLIVDTAQIYAEFVSEKLRHENIQEFISYAGTYWKHPLPKYFLLAGDLTMIPNFEFVSIPNYPDTDTSKSDYFYSENIYDEDENVLDFCVGRVAAANEYELQNYFSKVIDYESQTTIEQWNNSFTIIADNGICNSIDDGEAFEKRAFQIGQEMPDYMKINYFFESEESIYYSSPDSIIRFINIKGSAAMYFLGRGNSEIFTCDTMFNIQSFENLANGNKYFVASFSHAQRFSSFNSTSMLDRMLLSESGAIAGFNSVGLSYFSMNYDFITLFYESIFTETDKSVGEIVRSILSGSTREHRKYNLFGDPSLNILYDTHAPVNSFSDKIPDDYILNQNYPNPFNPVTIINFQIPESENIRLMVYDMLGREIRTLVDGHIEAGYHQISFDGSGLNSGVYLYKLESKSFSMVRKMLLVK
jgi:hypothetical protein